MHVENTSLIGKKRKRLPEQCNSTSLPFLPNKIPNMAHRSSRAEIKQIEADRALEELSDSDTDAPTLAPEATPAADGAVEVKVQFPADPLDVKAWEPWSVPESKSPDFLIKFKSIPNYKGSHLKADRVSDAAETAFRLAAQNKYGDTAMVVFDWMVRYSQSVWDGKPVPKPATEHARAAGIGFRIAIKTLQRSGWKIDLE